MSGTKQKRNQAIVWLIFLGGASLVTWYFGWIIGLFISVWALTTLLGMNLLILDGHSIWGLRLAHVGLYLNSAAFWFVGAEAFPLFVVFGILVFFGVVIINLIHQAFNQTRISYLRVLSAVFFVSAIFGPRFGLKGYELQYSNAIYFVIATCEVVIMILVQAGLVAVKHSMDEEKRSKAKLSEAKTWYVESFGMISHNIKNPLAVIVSRLELAQLKSKLKGTVELSSMEVKELRAKADEINTLLMQFLALHKENNKKLDNGPITLKELVTELCQVHQCELTELSDKVSGTQLDEVSLFALRQALEVLIDNAKKYAGHVPELTLSERGVRVRDYGPGLTDEQAAVYGKQFVESRSLSGSGIGLFFAAQLLQKAGWNMRLLDHNNGLTVKIEPSIQEA